MKNENIENMLNMIFLNPKDILFLVGAGASAPSPTCIPTILSFYKSLIKASGLSSSYVTKLLDKIDNHNIQPRFEVFIYEFKKIDTDNQLYNIFNLKTYNVIHYFIACCIKVDIYQNMQFNYCRIKS